MSIRTNAVILLVAIAGAGAGFFVGGRMRSPNLPPATSAALLEIGQPRPDLDLPDTAAQLRKLDEWDGKLVLVNFWASWCGPCREEMPLLDHTQQRYAGRGLQVIGVAVDDAESVHDFLAAHPVAYPILVADPDEGPDASRLYGDNRGVLPYSVLVGRDGRVLAQRYGSFSAAGLDAWLSPHL